MTDRSRQEIWNELMSRGAQMTPEYGHEKLLVDRFLFFEMDQAMMPTRWESFCAWFWRWM